MDCAIAQTCILALLSEYFVARIPESKFNHRISRYDLAAAMSANQVRQLWEHTARVMRQEYEVGYGTTTPYAKCTDAMVSDIQA